LQVTRPVYTSTALLEVVQSAQNPNATEVDTLRQPQDHRAEDRGPADPAGGHPGKHLVDDPEFAVQTDSGPFRDSDAARWVVDTARDVSGRISGSVTAPVAPAKYSETELAKRLSSQVQVNVLRGSRLIAVSTEGPHRGEGAAAGAGRHREFFRQSQEGRTRDSASTRELQLAEASRMGAELRASEEKLEAYRAKYNAVSLQERQNIVSNACGT